MVDNLDNRERPKGVNLRVIQPEGDKHHMIGFDATTAEQAEAYNDAIGFYLKQANLKPFHQVGPEGGPGYSAWEIWTDQKGALLEELLPQIEQAAQTLLSRDPERINKLYENWYPSRS